jgi:hypothetical protein
MPEKKKNKKPKNTNKKQIKTNVTQRQTNKQHVNVNVRIEQPKRTRARKAVAKAPIAQQVPQIIYRDIKSQYPDYTNLTNSAGMPAPNPPVINPPVANNFNVLGPSVPVNPIVPTLSPVNSVEPKTPFIPISSENDNMFDGDIISSSVTPLSSEHDYSRSSQRSENFYSYDTMSEVTNNFPDINELTYHNYYDNTNEQYYNNPIIEDEKSNITPEIIDAPLIKESEQISVPKANKNRIVDNTQVVNAEEFDVENIKNLFDKFNASTFKKYHSLVKFQSMMKASGLDFKRDNGNNKTKAEMYEELNSYYKNI